MCGKQADVIARRVRSNSTKFCHNLRIPGCVANVCVKCYQTKVYTMASANYFKQRVALKFFVKCGKLRQETVVALQTVNGDHIMPKSSFYELYKLFTGGREDCNNTPHSGCAVEVCNAISQRKVEQALKDDCWLLVQQIAFLAYVNRKTVRQILTEELNMRKVCSKLDSKKFDQ